MEVDAHSNKVIWQYLYFDRFHYILSRCSTLINYFEILAHKMWVSQSTTTWSCGFKVSQLMLCLIAILNNFSLRSCTMITSQENCGFPNFFLRKTLLTNRTYNNGKTIRTIVFIICFESNVLSLMSHLDWCTQKILNSASSSLSKSNWLDTKIFLLRHHSLS